MRRQTNWLLLTVVCLAATALLAYASWQGFVGWVADRGGDVMVDTTPGGPSWWGLNNRQECQFGGPPDPGWVAFTLYAGHTRVMVLYPKAGRAAGTGPTAAAP